MLPKKGDQLYLMTLESPRNFNNFFITKFKAAYCNYAHYNGIEIGLNCVGGNQDTVHKFIVRGFDGHGIEIDRDNNLFVINPTEELIYRVKCQVSARLIKNANIIARMKNCDPEWKKRRNCD